MSVRHGLGRWLMVLAVAMPHAATAACDADGADSAGLADSCVNFFFGTFQPDRCPE